MTTMPVDPLLAEAADRITVAPDALSATVDGRPLRADTRRDLRNQLCLTVYRVLHSGSEAPATDSALMPRPGRDPLFEDKLAAVVPHDHGLEFGVVLESEEVGGTTRWTIQLPEITASVPAERIADDDRPAVGAVVRVLLDCRRPRVSPGFYYVVGSRSLGEEALGVRRLFVHLTEPGPAVQTWGLLLGMLEDAGVRYHAKILSTRTEYPRRDAVVVYLVDPTAGLERRIAAELAGRSGVGAETSAFTERLAPGIGGADNPADPRPGYAGLSFGQHRSLLLATALVHDATAGAPASRDETIAGLFREAGVDPLRPARNLLRESANV